MKKFFTLIIMTMIGFATSWAADVVSIIHTNGTEARYSSLNDAWSSVQSGETIKLLDDRTFAGTFTARKSFTIDLNGHTISSTKDFQTQYLFATVGANTLTIKNGTLLMQATGSKATNPNATLTEEVDQNNFYACIGVGKGTTVIANKVDFDGGELGVCISGTLKTTSCTEHDANRYGIYTGTSATWISEQDKVRSIGMSTVYIGNNSTVNMNKTEVNASNTTNGFMTSTGNITLTSCRILTQLGIALYAYNSAKVNVDDCYIYSNSTNTTVYINNSAVVTLNNSIGYNYIQNNGTGCGIKNNSKLISADCPNSNQPVIRTSGIGILNSGTTSLGNILVETSDDGIQATAGTVTINSNVRGCVIYSVSKNALNAAGGNITVENISGCDGKLAESDGGKLIIRAGYYTADPSYYTEPLYKTRIVDSSEAAYQEDFRYEVIFSPTVYNVTQNKYYDGLYDALKVATEGNEIKVLKNISLGTQYNITAKNLTIDLNGYTITKTSSNNYNSAFIINADNVTIKKGTINYGGWSMSDSRVITVNANNATISGVNMSNAKNGVWVNKSMTNAFLDGCNFSNITEYLFYIDENAAATARYCKFDCAAGCKKLINVGVGAEYISYVGNDYKYKNGGIDLRTTSKFREYNGKYSGTGLLFNTWSLTDLELRECTINASSTSSEPTIDSYGDVTLKGCNITDNGTGSTIVMAYPNTTLNVCKYQNLASTIVAKSTAITCKSISSAIIKDDATITSSDKALVAIENGSIYVESGYIIGKLEGNIEIENGYFSVNPASFVTDGCTSKALASGSPLYSAGYRYEVSGTPVTSIDALTPETVNAPVYNLQGARLTTPTRGLNIVGGKKVMVK